MFDPIAELARQVVGPLELCLIFQGDREGARSRITSSFQGATGGRIAYQVTGPVVRYTTTEGRGEVKVAQLITHAAECLTPEAGELLTQRYRAYVEAATVDYVLGGPTYEKNKEWNDQKGEEARQATRALHEAADAVWTSEPAGQQTTLF